LSDKKIGVLYGGLSSEKEISIKSGKAMIEALKKKGYNVVPILVDKNINATLLKKRIDIAVIGLHGKMGEDGTVQGLLECLGIPYTGSGVAASSLAMNKILTKKLATTLNIQTPSFESFHISQAAEIEKRLICPVVIKSQAEGSSRGTTIVRDKKDLRGAIEDAAQYDDVLLAEQFIEGPEVTAPILGEQVLPLIEIVPNSGFFDYHAKYTKGATEYIIPARLSKDTTKKIGDMALHIYQGLQCRGYGRVDFMVDQHGTPWFIELNTLPGMTETSLVPMSAAKAGISFEDLVERILSTAALDHEKLYKR